MYHTCTTIEINIPPSICCLIILHPLFTPLSPPPPPPIFIPFRSSLFSIGLIMIAFPYHIFLSSLPFRIVGKNFKKQQIDKPVLDFIILSLAIKALTGGNFVFNFRCRSSDSFQEYYCIKYQPLLSACIKIAKLPFLYA